MDSLANRYSTALLDIAVEENKINEYQEACKVINQCIKENPDFMRILFSSFVNYDDKKKIIENVVGKFKLENLTNFFYVILDHKRMHYLKEILNDFNSKCNEKLGVEEGIAYTVNKLSSDQLSRIEKAISTKIGRDVELKNEIDTTLLGGVKVVVNDKVFDGTVLNKVETLKNSLLKGGK